jgi:predicted lipoprotein with Yx(FWY)xxD motif
MRSFFVIATVSAALVCAASTMADSASRASVAVRGSSYGPILFDGRGFVLYAFTKDAKGRSACGGGCAKAWPPYIVSGRPGAQRGTMSGAG